MNAPLFDLNYGLPNVLPFCPKQYSLQPRSTCRIPRPSSDNFSTSMNAFRTATIDDDLHLQCLHWICHGGCPIFIARVISKSYRGRSNWGVETRQEAD